MAVENKNIFITGSTDGIGKMLAIEFAKKGANIIAHGRNSKTLDSLYAVSYTHLTLPTT